MFAIYYSRGNGVFTEVVPDVESTSTGLFSCPDTHNDPNLEMYEVADKVLL